jgi:hypothetical protein
MATEIPQEISDLFLPVLESGVVLASHYAKACGRDVVTQQDVQIGLMFAARNVAGKQIGTLFPEIYEEDEEEDEEEWETDSEGVVDDSEGNEFTRYTGTDEMIVKMNECFDTWDSWTPESPLEQSLKNAVDRAGQNV